MDYILIDKKVREGRRMVEVKEMVWRDTRHQAVVCKTGWNKWRLEEGAMHRVEIKIDVGRISGRKKEKWNRRVDRMVKEELWQWMDRLKSKEEGGRGKMWSMCYSN